MTPCGGAWGTLGVKQGDDFHYISIANHMI